MEQPLSLTRRLVCLPIYLAMTGGGAFLIYEKLQGLEVRLLELVGGVLMAMGLYLLWTDVVSPILRKKA
jgi:hypothetical protein